MVKGEAKKVDRKTVKKSDRFSSKSAVKKKSSVQKKKPSARKSPVKATATKVKQSHTKKAPSTSSAVKSKPKAPTVEKPTKKASGKTSFKGESGIKLKKASKGEIRQVENVIEKLSLRPESRKVTTVPGVLRKATAAKRVSDSEKPAPIVRIINYLKKMF